MKLSNRILVGASVLVSMVAVMSSPLMASAATLYRQLEVGMRGTDVSDLQTFLATDPTIYPQGLVTGYFGFLTKSAVANFQSRNGIEAVGRVGPQTLPIINAQMAGGVSTGGDRSSATIVGMNVSTGNVSAVLSFGTTDMARAKVYYSTSPIHLSNTFDDYGVDGVEPTISGNLAPYDSVARQSHSITLSGLTPNTTYYYEVVALDSSNNASLTSPAHFTTAQ